MWAGTCLLMDCDRDVNVDTVNGDDVRIDKDPRIFGNQNYSPMVRLSVDCDQLDL